MKETIIDLKTRRSCRKYTDRQIDEELLRGMGDVSAAWTANGKVMSTGSELTLIN